LVTLSEDGQYQISSAVKFAANGVQSLSVSADSSDSTTINLASNVEYVLLLTARQSGDVLSTQVINLVCNFSHLLTQKQRNDVSASISDLFMMLGLHMH
jgi:hypothetical protein